MYVPKVLIFFELTFSSKNLGVVQSIEKKYTLSRQNTKLSFFGYFCLKQWMKHMLEA